LILSLLFLSSFYCSFLGCKNVFTARSLDWMAPLLSVNQPFQLVRPCDTEM
jgi:hypothetical protein